MLGRKISKSMNYDQFIDAVAKSFKAEWSPITASVSVVCVEGADYYEVDTVNHTFGKLKFVSSISYQYGKPINADQRKFINNMRGVIVSKRVKDRWVVQCYHRVGMYYAS